MSLLWNERHRAHPKSTYLSINGRLSTLFSSIIRDPRFIWICFCAFILVRTSVLLVPFTPVHDSLWYLDRAIDLSQGHGYTLDRRPTAYYPVGWSAFLAIFFKLIEQGLLVAQLVNLVLAAGTFFLILAIARITFHDEMIARIGVLLIAAYPNNIAYVAIPTTETFFTFLLLLGWLLWIRFHSIGTALASGAVFGLATLTKSQAILLPAFVIAMALFRSTHSRTILYARSLALCVATALAVSPWMYRNYETFGRPILSTNGGMNMLLGNNSFAHGGYTSDASDVGSIDFSDGNEGLADSVAARRAIDWISTHPVRFLSILPLKIARLWVLDGEAIWIYQSGYARFNEQKLYFQTLRYINQGYYLLLMSGFLMAPIVWRRRTGSYFPQWTGFGYGLAAFTTAASLVTFGDPRFHFFVMPFAALSCASAMVLLFRKIR